MSYIPTIAMTGLYDLLQPYDKLLVAKVPYECITLRKISAYMADGVDVYNTFYQPLSDTPTAYQADLKNDETLVTLKSDFGHSVTVPARAINGYPNLGGIRYVRMGIALDLGYIPDYLSLKDCGNQVNQLVQNILGIVPTFQIAKIGASIILSGDQDDAKKAERLQKVTHPETLLARAMKAEADLAACKITIAKLEKYIQDHP